MKANTTPLRPVSDDSAKLDTGRTLAAWYSLLDDSGALTQGRATILDHLSAKRVDPWWAETIAAEYERTRGVVEKDGRPLGYVVTVATKLPAPVGRVFRHVAEERLLDQWLGPDTSVTFFAEGGHFRNGDGNRGCFRRIETERIVRIAWEDPTLGPGSEVEFSFRPKGAARAAFAVAHSRIQERGHADGLQAGWDGALAALREIFLRAWGKEEVGSRLGEAGG
ncbi:MAG: SRPBCC domain-containing protein [Gemmatimonadales bacterium]|nr:SRPBCC domain-containing protein [Gemmatimonadales bacterium]